MESQNENKYYVYAISDPVNRRPFYQKDRKNFSDYAKTSRKL
jgi:hypothetical protein